MLDLSQKSRKNCSRSIVSKISSLQSTISRVEGNKSYESMDHHKIVQRLERGCPGKVGGDGG